MFRSTYRSRRHRNAHTHDEQQVPSQPFFGKTVSQSVQRKPAAPFFQAKLSVNQPNDKYEREANTVANTVVNNQGSTSVVQQKEISGIQRLSTAMEEEKLGSNDAGMLRDKEIQTKPEIQRMCPECEKEKEGMIQQTSEGTAATASTTLSNRIESSAGNGKSLPQKTLNQMQSSFGVDFSHVNVHTDSASVQMNRELNAQAFTHGSDIYFNSGKYNPETSGGKLLLAHELTHVVQQGAANNEEVQRSCHDGACESCAGGVRDFWITFYFRRRATRRTMNYLRQQINEAKTILANCCLRLKADFNWSLLPGGGTFNFMDATAGGGWRYSADASALGTGNTFAGSRGIPVLVVDDVPASGGGVTVDRSFDTAYAGRTYAVIGVNQVNPNPGCNHLAHELWHVGSRIVGHDVAHGTLAACSGNTVSEKFCLGLRNIVAPVGDFPMPASRAGTAVA
jgi:Domain of unknown function (DUF4157)